LSVTNFDPDQQYRQGAWHITAAAVEHGHGLGLTYEEWPCLAYRIDIQGRSVVISGDTVACASLIALAQGADVLVQCCFLADAELTTPARRLLAEQVIATSGQVGKIATQAGVKTLVLTHFSAMAPEMLAAIEQDVRRDFGGQLYMGSDLFVLDLEDTSAFADA
jgi:ribonuclease Z